MSDFTFKDRWVAIHQFILYMIFIFVFAIFMKTDFDLMTFDAISAKQIKMENALRSIKRDQIAVLSVFYELSRIGAYPDSLLSNHYETIEAYDSISATEWPVIEMTSDSTWRIVERLE